VVFLWFIEWLTAQRNPRNTASRRSHAGAPPPRRSIPVA
jgi:hypothetical protein